MNTLLKYYIAVVAMLFSTLTTAGIPTDYQPPDVRVSEPEMLPLMAVGALIIWLASRRKK